MSNIFKIALIKNKWYCGNIYPLWYRKLIETKSWLVHLLIIYCIIACMQFINSLLFMWVRFPSTNDKIPIKITPCSYQFGGNPTPLIICARTQINNFPISDWLSSGTVVSSCGFGFGQRFLFRIGYIKWPCYL